MDNSEAAEAAPTRISMRHDLTDERIVPGGRTRRSVRFSIIDSEWPTVKAALHARLAPA